MFITPFASIQYLSRIRAELKIIAILLTALLNMKQITFRSQFSMKENLDITENGRKAVTIHCSGDCNILDEDLILALPIGHLFFNCIR